MTACSSPSRLYLASTSPRRGALLQQIGVPFERLNIAVDETPTPAEPPEAFVLRMASEKARAGWQQVAALKGDVGPVLGADTAVVVGQTILGKPDGWAGFETMMQQLSDQQHQVLTAVALVDAKGVCHTTISCSRVQMKSLSRGEIAAYWESGEPVDKAGGYAIQGLGALLITHLEGSYSGVMGLPLYETAQLLRQHTPLLLLS